MSSETPAIPEEQVYIPHDNGDLSSESEPRAPVLSGDQLNCVGLGLSSIPGDLGVTYGTQVRQLDFSYNEIRKIENLEKFKNLQSLVLDNNDIVSDQKFPPLTSLHTLSVNNNNINDLKAFLDCLAKACPNLKYLSMLKNAACPNYFVGKDFDDYQRYRYYVLFRLKKLKFLDSTAVTADEIKEAGRVGPYMVILKPDESQYKKKPETAPEQQDHYEPLSAESAPEGKGSARFGMSNYVYYGKHSEGNRFIMNDDL